MGVLSASALARTAAFYCLRGIFGHSELELACVLLVVILWLAALRLIVIFFIILPDLLGLNDAHPHPEQASAAHQ